MKIFCYNAGCGDAFKIEFIGHSGLRRHLLLDAGYERTYRNVLADDFAKMERDRLTVDLCIGTHIHDDHIGGLKSWINAMEARRSADIVAQWWFNSPRIANNKLHKSKSISAPQSIRQADIITRYLVERDSLFKTPIVFSKNPYTLDGMEIFVLSPDLETYTKLVDKYKDVKTQLENIEDHQTSRPTAKKVRDYYKILEDIDLNTWEEDKNLENRSSIALLTKFESKCVLWLSDAHPSVIVKSLKNLGYSDKKPVECDYVKIAHHGSFGNNSAELYKMIKCKKYILSSNGINVHGLPSKACLAQILTNPSRAKDDFYTFYLTSDDHILRSIFQIDGDEVYQKYNFEIIYPIEKNGFSIHI